MAAIGIDFGTSFNKVGLFDKFGYKIINNRFKRPYTPSVAFFHKQNKYLCGERAIKYIHEMPKQCIFDTKIMIGHQIDNENLKQILQNLSFDTKYEENDIKIIIESDGEQHEYYPSEIIGVILNNLIEISNLNNIKNTSPIVISIPALCDEEYVKELTKASIHANLKKFHFKKEPILASIAYLSNLDLNDTEKQTIVVFDLGRYYLDVSIIEIVEENYSIHTERNEEVSAIKFTENIFKYVKSLINEQNISNKQNIDSELFDECEEAKIALSELNKVYIPIQGDNKITLTSKKFNELNEELFFKCKETVEKAMNETRIDKEDVDHLFFVGGSTLMKKVREIVKETVRKEANLDVDPREAVALGACIAGGNLYSDGMNNNSIFANRVISILLNEKKQIKSVNFLQSKRMDDDQKQAMQEMQSHIRILEAKCNKLEKCLNNSQNQLSNNIYQSNQLFSFIQKLRKKNQNLNEAKLQLKKQISEINDQKNKLKKENENLNEEKLQLEKQISEINDQKNKLKKENENLNEEKLPPKKQISDIKFQNIKLKKENENLNEEKLQLEKQISEINMKLEKNVITKDKYLYANINANMNDYISQLNKNESIELKQKSIPYKSSIIDCTSNCSSSDLLTKEKFKWKYEFKSYNKGNKSFTTKNFQTTNTTTEKFNPSTDIKKKISQHFQPKSDLYTSIYSQDKISKKYHYLFDDDDL